MMTQVATIDQNARKARNLLQQGYVAYNNWELDKARLLWRKAAVVDPANEEIWVALLNVTRDDEDRRVCLQNILVLNPENEEAEQRLRLMENETQPATAQTVESQLERYMPSIDERIQLGVSWTLSAILIIIAGILLFSMLIQAFV